MVAVKRRVSANYQSMWKDTKIFHIHISKTSRAVYAENQKKTPKKQTPCVLNVFGKTMFCGRISLSMTLFFLLSFFSGLGAGGSWFGAMDWWC